MDYGDGLDAAVAESGGAREECQIRPQAKQEKMPERHRGRAIGRKKREKKLRFDMRRKMAG
jgi:hypothetical protein